MIKKSLAIATLSLLVASTAMAHSIRPVRDFRGNFAEDFRGNCLRTKWVANHDECGFGEAPAAPVVEAAQPSQIQAEISYIDLIRQSIYFNIDKYNIDSDDVNRMNQVINEVNNSQGVQSVKFVGYADKFANYGYNQRLSDKRVNNVLNHFKSQGYFTAGNIASAFYGDTKPVTNCDLKLPKSQLVECRQTDRRVDIEVELIRKKTEIVSPNDPRIGQQFTPQVTVPVSNLVVTTVNTTSQAVQAQPYVQSQQVVTQAYAPAKNVNTPVAKDSKGRKLPKSMQPAYNSGFVTEQVTTTTTQAVAPVVNTQTIRTTTTTINQPNITSGVEAVDHLYPVYNGEQQVAPQNLAPATQEQNTIQRVDEMLNRR